MRQVQQLLVTLTLGWIALTLLLIALILGAGSVWRDMEKRWLLTLFGLPVQRYEFLVAKLVSMFLCLLLAASFMGALGTLVLLGVGDQYSTAFDFSLKTYWFAIFFTALRYMLLATIAQFFLFEYVVLFSCFYLSGSFPYGLCNPGR